MPAHLFQEARNLNPNDKAVQRALERVEEELRRKGTPWTKDKTGGIVLLTNHPVSALQSYQ
jgi:hypothetical protein